MQIKIFTKHITYREWVPCCESMELALGNAGGIQFIDWIPLDLRVYGGLYGFRSPEAMRWQFHFCPWCGEAIQYDPPEEVTSP